MTEPLRLKVFGSPALVQPSGNAVASVQPKRIAILTYLALTDREISRDTLVAMFWPDQAEAPARNSLNQALHALRRLLPEDALRSEQTTVRVDSSRLECDAKTFDAHIAAGSLEEALQLYSAPFLEGFFLPRVPDYEHWVDEIRSGYQRRAMDAAWTLSAERLAQRDPNAARRFGQHAHDLADPLDERALRKYLKLLDDVGDRSTALAVYAAFQARLLAEYGAEPAPETQASVNAMRGRVAPRSSPASVPAQSAATHPEGAVNALNDSGTAVAKLAEAPSGMPPRGHAYGWTLGVVAFVMLGVVVAAIRGAGNGTADSTASAHRASGAEYVTRLHAAAAASTQSREAAAAFVEGDTELRRGRFVTAVAALQRAVEIDSTFGLAHLQLSRAANRAVDFPRERRSAAAARRHSESLPAPWHLQTEAWERFRRGDFVGAEPLFARLLADDSANVDAMRDLADLRFHWGSQLGQPAASTAPLWEAVLALSPNDPEASAHLLRVLAASGRRTAFEAHAAALAAHDSGGVLKLEADALRAFVFGGRADKERVANELASAPFRVVAGVIHAVSYAVPGSEDVADMLGPLLMRSEMPNRARQLQFYVRVQLEVAAGRKARAVNLLDSAAAHATEAALEFHAALAVLPTWRATRDELLVLRERLRTESSARLPRSVMEREYAKGMVAIRLGEADEVIRSIRAIDAFSQPARGPIAYREQIRRLLQAEFLNLQGRYGEALAALGDPAPTVNNALPTARAYHEAHARFIRAELLASLGRKDEAARWLATFPDPSAYDLAWVPAARLRLSALR